MSSMRKLKRRLLRLERYAARTPHRGTKTPAYWRIRHAIDDELFRRVTGAAAATYEGWYEEREDNGCCEAGDDGHPGACWRLCSECGGGRLCPECGGEDDLGCGECEGTGSCPECHGSGELFEDMPYVPTRRIETITPVGGIL